MKQPTTTLRVKSRRLDEIEEDILDFEEHPWLPWGVLTEIIGDGKLGKSLVLIHKAARYSLRDDLPESKRCVGIVAAEDAVEYVIKPRLRAIGADMTRIHFLDSVEEVDAHGKAVKEGQWLRLPGHVGALEWWVSEESIGLLVIDPITSFVESDLDISHPQDARDILTPLLKMVERQRLACLYIRHIGKDRSRGASAAGLGSVELRNIVRSQWLVGRKPGDRLTRVMANNGANYLSDETPALTFTIEETSLMIRGKVVGIPRLVWGKPDERLTAEDILSDARKDEGVELALSIIEQLVKDQDPVPSAVFNAAMKENGVGHSAKERAQAAANLKPIQSWVEEADGTSTKRTNGWFMCDNRFIWDRDEDGSWMKTLPAARSNGSMPYLPDADDPTEGLITGSDPPPSANQAHQGVPDHRSASNHGQAHQGVPDRYRHRTGNQGGPDGPDHRLGETSNRSSGPRRVIRRRSN